MLFYDDVLTGKKRFLYGESDLDIESILPNATTQGQPSTSVTALANFLLIDSHQFPVLDPNFESYVVPNVVSLSCIQTLILGSLVHCQGEDNIQDSWASPVVYAF